MKPHPEFRSGRTGLVIAINGLLIAVRLFMFLPRSWTDLFWIGVPLVGIALEVVRSPAARVVNVGFYALLAGVIIVVVAFASFKLFGFGEPEHLATALWLAGVPSVIIALFLNWLYRVTSMPSPVRGGFA
jgi:hypothetical protein